MTPGPYTAHSSGSTPPLYRSFEVDWRSVGYVTIPTRREAFEPNAMDRLRLVPRPYIHQGPTP